MYVYVGVHLYSIIYKILKLFFFLTACGVCWNSLLDFFIIILLNNIHLVFFFFISFGVKLRACGGVWAALFR